MNVRQDMLPQGIGQQQNMLISNPPFMQNSHLAQQGLVPSPLGMPQNMPPNPPMALLSGGPAPGGAPRYPMQPSALQQQQQLQPQQQRQMATRQGQTQPHHPGANPPSGVHMPSQLLQGMPFPSNIPSNMMQQPPGMNNAVRRVQSQPQLNPLGAMPPSVAGSMSMGMNPQTGMPGQIRQAQQAQNNQQQLQQHQLNQLRMQQMMPQQGMSADLSMMRAQAATSPPMQSNMGPRAGSTTQMQAMSSLTPSLSSAAHPGGMQPPHHQSTFPNGPIPSQHPPPQLSSSPRPNSTRSPGMSMSTPGPSHTPVNRPRMTPDNSNFMTYPGQFPGNNSSRVPPNQSPSSPYPSMQISDVSQPSPPGMMHSQGGTPNRPGFIPTPAQQQFSMSALEMHYGQFGMPPPPSVPPRTPSNTNPHLPPTPQQTPNPQQQQLQQPPTQQLSQQAHAQQLLQNHHRSPSHSDQMNVVHPQRPQSQPQRPPSQAGSGANSGPGSSSQISNTPRSLQPPLPPVGMSSGLTATGRITSQPSGQLMPIAPRPPTLPVGMGVGGQPHPPLGSTSATGIQSRAASVSGPSTSSGDLSQAGGTAPGIGRPPITAGPMMGLGAAQGTLGQGQGLIRLLQFSGVLASENKTKLQLSWWSEMIKEYFTPKAVMKLTLWKDNQRNEAKPFEIGVPILPRFFLVTTQSGVKSMTLSLDGARERTFGQGHSVVECVAAIWTYKYTNGYTITLRGPLTAHVIIVATHPPGNVPGNAQGQQFSYKFEDFQFDANFHDKSIALEAILGKRRIEPTPGPSGLTGQQQQQEEEDRKWEEPRTLIEPALIPGEPVNAFGIPQATMRCLELAESVSSMAELIIFAKETDQGPIDALTSYARKLRESGAVLPPPSQQQQLQPPHPPLPSHLINNSLIPFSSYQPPPSSTSSSATLFSSASPSITNPHPPGPPSSSMSSPANPSSSTNSPEKHPKTIPQQQQQQGQTPSGPASSPAISSGTTVNTPVMASEPSRKRKQAGDASSPTVGNPDQPPSKRVPGRKPRRGGAAGAG